MVVFDRDGNFLRSFGGLLRARAGVSWQAASAVRLAVHGDHAGKVHCGEGAGLTLGISGRPGQPF